MSLRLLGRSDDLRRLADQGFELQFRGPYLLVHHVPYVDAQRHVRPDGVLVVELTLAGDVTARPKDHVARFIGDAPCDAQGQPLTGPTGIINSSKRQDLGHGVVVDHLFSAKPPGGYRDYEHKVTAYVARITGPATQIDPSATARTFRPIESPPEESPFLYIDTATGRAGLELYAAKLAEIRLAIVGLGGTGSYLLDYVAKASVKEIHLYDGDRFLQHNPFRAPGATPAEELLGGPNKAEHWAAVYGRMRRGVIPHPTMVDENNLEELRDFHFVFVAIDHGPSRALILDALAAYGLPHIDVGMGIHDIDGRLSGKTRVSAGTREHPMDRRRVPTDVADPEDLYRNNIQIVELNAMNAALAVIKWKKQVGIYADLVSEHASTYTIALNEMVNEDCG